MKTYLLLLLVSLLASCSSGNKQTPQVEEAPAEASIPVLDLQGMMNKNIPDTLTWNSIAKNVTFIPLETSRRIMLSSSSFPEYVGDFIIMSDYKMNTVFTFDLEGKNIAMIKRTGQGPGEYVYLTDVYYDPAQSTINVFDNGNGKIISYDREGKYISEKSTKDITPGNLKHMEDGFSILKAMADSAAYWIETYDKDLNRVGKFFPVKEGLTRRDRFMNHRFSYKNNNRTSGIHNFNHSDTVYSITATSAEPVAVIKKGQYAVPENEIKDIMQRKDHNYIMTGTIDRIPGYFIVDYFHNNQLRTEVWDVITQTLVSRNVVEYEKDQVINRGITYEFESGKKIKTRPNYISNNKVVCIVSAEDVADELPGVKEDDNIVLMVIDF